MCTAPTLIIILMRYFGRLVLVFRAFFFFKGFFCMFHVNFLAFSYSSTAYLETKVAAVSRWLSVRWHDCPLAVCPDLT